jgi:hypothetical protein
MTDWKPVVAEVRSFGDFRVTVASPGLARGYTYTIECDRMGTLMPFQTKEVARAVALKNLRRMLQEALDALEGEAP